MRNMKTILVVDDDVDITETVRIILEKQGYGVATATKGDDCLKILQDSTPDLILLDIMMPGIPIEKVVKQIKGIKIAFMSVVKISEARRQGLFEQSNVVDFFQKPFNTADLINRIGLILNE